MKNIATVSESGDSSIYSKVSYLSLCHRGVQGTRKEFPTVIDPDIKQK
jgi:hypothetical protein